MKNHVVFIIFFNFVLRANAQTSLSLIQDFGSVKQWTMLSGKDTLGKAYTLESIPNIKFYPKAKDFVGKTFVITGTYTSDNDSVAGIALDNECHMVGNPKDPYFKPNGRLSFADSIEFVKESLGFYDRVPCNSIPVYILIENGNINYSFIHQRTPNKRQWRFMVHKSWIKTYSDRTTEHGAEWLVVDFDNYLTLSEACNYIAGMQRNMRYDDFKFESTLDACLLDTGTFRPFLLNGKSISGEFPLKQSNVIFVK